VAGFIYPDRQARPTMQIASAEAPPPVTPSRAFLQAFASFGASGTARQPLAATETRRRGKPVDLIAQLARN